MATHSIPSRSRPSLPCEPYQPESRDRKSPLPSQDHFLHQVGEKTLQDLERWYPPLVVGRNPTLRRLIAALFPPLGMALEWGQRAFEAGKKAWKNGIKK